VNASKSTRIIGHRLIGTTAQLPILRFLFVAQGVGRDERGGVPHSQRAHRLCEQRFVQPGRKADCQRKCRQNGQSVGRDERRGVPHPQGAHARCEQRGVQPRWPADCQRKLGQDGSSVGLKVASSIAFGTRTESLADVKAIQSDSIPHPFRRLPQLLPGSLRIPARRVEIFVAQNLGERHEVVPIVGEKLVSHRVP
jgi:hypothetical protein